MKAVFVLHADRPDGWWVITGNPDAGFQIRGDVDDAPFKSQDEARVAAAYDLNEPWYARESVGGVVALGLDDES